jgi:hypothetical protein
MKCPFPVERALETVVKSALPAVYVADGLEANGAFSYDERESVPCFIDHSMKDAAEVGEHDSACLTLVNGCGER